MGQKLYGQSEDGIVVKSGRKAWGVDIPAYVYDVWMPLIGYQAVFVYGLLWRLAVDGSTKKISLKKLAKAARMGDKTITAQTELLAHLGFIQIIEPDSYQKSMHFTNEYIILDPPTEISAEVIESFRPTDSPDWTYEPLTPWLIESASSNDDAASSDNDVTASGDDANIDPSGIDPVGVQTTTARATAPAVPRVKPNRKTVEDDRDTQTKRWVSPTDPGFPSVGRLLVDALQRAGTEKTTLTERQIVLLREPVLLKDVREPQPSPQDECDVFPDLFERFMNQILTMPGLIRKANGRPISAGMLIDAMRGYRWLQGWHDFRPNVSLRPSVATQEENEDILRMSATKEIFNG